MKFFEDIIEENRKEVKNEIVKAITFARQFKEAKVEVYANGFFIEVIHGYNRTICRVLNVLDKEKYKLNHGIYNTEIGKVISTSSDFMYTVKIQGSANE